MKNGLGNFKIREYEIGELVISVQVRLWRYKFYIYFSRFQVPGLTFHRIGKVYFAKRKPNFEPDEKKKKLPSHT